MIYNSNKMKQLSKTDKLYFAKEETLKYIDSLNLTHIKKMQVYATLDQMRMYAKGDISYKKLDEYMLFTDMKMKNIAWKIEAKMFPNKKPMRDEFE